MQSYVDYLRMIDNALIINKKVDKLTACRGVILTKWHCTAMLYDIQSLRNYQYHRRIQAANVVERVLSS